jgi:hypothetical protein
MRLDVAVFSAIIVLAISTPDICRSQPAPAPPAAQLNQPLPAPSVNVNPVVPPDVFPGLPPGKGAPECENPLYVPLGPNSYGTVYERVFDVVSEYFEIAYANRYDGRIECFPRVAPGLEQPWRPGSPDLYQRLLATFQSIRHRCFVLITLADDGGFFVQVVVFRELEDVPKPIRSTAGAAAFRSDNTVERQFEVIDPAVFERSWAPMGRDVCLENAIVQKIKKCL